MEKVLFINACVRPGSRTLELAEALLRKLKGEVQEVKLYETQYPVLDIDGIEKRVLASGDNDFAAPYWDLMFPAVLKAYLENITVSGITFEYSDQGIPQSLCKAKTLHYVTTSGGYIGQNDFGFSYINALAQNFFGITEIRRYTAEGLDIFGTDVQKVMEKAKLEIASDI